MAQGRLSGKYLSQKPTWHADDNRTQHVADEDLSRYQLLQAELPEGMTLAQAALQWALANPAHHSVCLGAKNLSDYESAIRALEMEQLSQETFAKLEELTGDLRRSRG